MTNQEGIQIWEKQIKATKRKKDAGYSFRININKEDNFKPDEKVIILRTEDYKLLQGEIKQLKIYEMDNETLEEKDKEISDLTVQIQNKNSEIVNLDQDIKKLKESSKETTNITQENNNLVRENTKLFKEIKTLKKQLQDQEYENKKLSLKLETIEENYKNILKNNEKNLKESHDKFYETIEKLTKEHHEQLKESYDKFNEDLKKYISVNQLQNVALKQILELGFIDLIRNKHKIIAKKQIKELDQKPVYELIKKED